MTQQWDTLERWLRTMVDRLWTVSNPHSGLIAKFKLWAFPAAYGYMSYTGSKQNVQELAIGAQDTFFPLIAACTFIILACKERQATDPNFDWKWQISQHVGNGDSTPRKVHPAWIHDLMGSFAGDLDVERITAIFDPTDPAILPFLFLFKLVNMPTILHWGTIGRLTKTPYLEQTTNVTASAQDVLIPFGPKRGPMDRLLAEQSHICSERDTRYTEPLETCSMAEVSSALPGELIRDFLERHCVAQEEKEAEESQSAQHQHLQNESEAIQSHAPGKKGPRVWHWEKVYLGEGIDEFFCVRMLLMRRDVDSYWPDYSSSQRVFNSWQNCWDICSDLGNDPSSYEHDFDDPIDVGGPGLSEYVDKAQGLSQTSLMEADHPRSNAELKAGELEEGEMREEVSTQLCL
ncbi:hypothetical protein PM082_018164 [Marasmius tenuissimus]|nr:hypothetical protein PM082_018164 [Marasmius tenuissimus]